MGLVDPLRHRGNDRAPFVVGAAMFRFPHLRGPDPEQHFDRAYLAVSQLLDSKRELAARRAISLADKSNRIGACLAANLFSESCIGDVVIVQVLFEWVLGGGHHPFSVRIMNIKAIRFVRSVYECQTVYENRIVRYFWRYGREHTRRGEGVPEGTNEGAADR